MDKIFKRAVSILVALVMTIVMIPANAFVSFADGGGNLKSSKATANATENLTAEGEITEAKYQKVNSIDTQSDYLIVYENGGTSVALNNKGDSDDNDTSINITPRSDGDYDITNVANNMLWNFDKKISGNESGVKITSKSSNQNSILIINNSRNKNDGNISVENKDDDLYMSTNNQKFSIYDKFSSWGCYYNINLKQ